MATFSYFADKLSAETRVLIYGFVFGPFTHVKRTHQHELPTDAKKDERVILFDSPAESDALPIATSIFAANKMIGGEAMETFYNTKSVRLTFTQMHNDAEQGADYLNLVRKIEFVDCFNHFLFRPKDIMHKALGEALQLPKIKSVTILSEYLAYNPNHPGYNNGIKVHECFATVGEFARSAELGEATCIDVGRYTIQAGKFKALQFANSKLLKMWPSVQNTPEDYDGYLAAREVKRQWSLSGSPSNILAYASQTSLRIWVGLYEQWLYWACRDAPDPPPGEIVNGEWFDRMSVGRYLKTRLPDVSIAAQGRRGETVPMHKLGPQHDPKTLEWATEFLALNIETFSYLTDGFDTKALDAKAYWPELQGGKGIGALQAGWQEESSRHFEESYLIPVPCLEGHFWDLDMIRERLLDDSNNVGKVMFGEDQIRSAGKDGLQKMFYLMVAAGLWAVHEDDENAEVDRWSVSLLKKYLLGTGSLDGRGVESATLEKVRKVFTLAVGVATLAHESGDAEEATPETPDPDMQSGSEEGELHQSFMNRMGTNLKIWWLVQTALDKAHDNTQPEQGEQDKAHDGDDKRGEEVEGAEHDEDGADGAHEAEAGNAEK